MIQEQGLGVNITVLFIYKKVHDPGNLSVNDRNEKKFKNAKPQSGMINIFDKEKVAAPLFCAVASGSGTDSEAVVDLLMKNGADINLGL